MSIICIKEGGSVISTSQGRRQCLHLHLVLGEDWIMAVCDANHSKSHLSQGIGSVPKQTEEAAQ